VELATALASAQNRWSRPLFLGKRSVCRGTDQGWSERHSLSCRTVVSVVGAAAMKMMFAARVMVMVLGVGVCPGLVRLVWAEESADVSTASAAPAKSTRIEKLDDKTAAMGLNGAMRWGGLWPAGMSLGAHWYMRQHFTFARFLGFGMDAYFFSPAYQTALYGYPVNGFDLTFVGRLCYTPGPVDLCGSLGVSDAILQINVGPPTHNTGAFTSIHPSMNFGILPELVVNVSMDFGFYFKHSRLLIDNKPDQPWEPNTLFGMLSIGLAYRAAQK